MNTIQKWHKQSHISAVVLLIVIGLTLSLIGLLLQMRTKQLYKSKAAAQTGPSVNVSMSVGDCVTTSTKYSCAITGNPGDLITVKVSAIATEKLSAANLFFNYNQNGINSVAYETVTVLTKDTNNTPLFTPVLEKVRDFNEGKLLQLTLVSDRTTNELSNQVLFTLTFRLLTADPANIIFVSAPSSAVGPIANYKFVLVPQNELGTDDDRLLKTLHIAVNHQGSGGNGKTVELKTKVRFNPFTNSVPQACSTIKGKVQLVSQSTNTHLSKSNVSFTANTDGTFSATTQFDNVVAAPDYQILIKGPHHTQKRFCVLNPQNGTNGRYNCSSGSVNIGITTTSLDANLSAVAVPLGDIAVQNGIADMRDLLTVKNLFYKTTSSDLTVGDLNCDGAINGADYSLLLGELQKGYADEN